MSEKSGIVYKTANYALFKSLPGNRLDYALRGERLTPSLKLFGQLEPIMVNEKYEVIDGQARLYALKKMGMPVEYIIKANVGHDACIGVNTSQQSWRLEDYVQSYASLGYVPYQYLFNLKQQFPMFSYSALSAVARGKTAAGGSIYSLKEGRFSITEEDYNMAVAALTKAASIKSFIPQGSNSFNYYLCVFCVFVSLPEIDANRLIEQMIKHSNLLYPAPNADEAAKMLNDVYNYNIRKNRQNIYTLFLEYIDKHEPRKAERRRRRR